MCGDTDPTQYDVPRTTCQRMVWTRGEDRRCGQSVGVTSWTDHTGVVHHGCQNHVDGMKRRYPESIPESMPGHGTLALGTPWARGAFGPADRIEVENLIPHGWTIGVSAYQGRHGQFNVWLNDPSGERVHALENRRDPVAASRRLALFGQVDDAARYTFATEPWVLDDDGGASVPVSYMREERAAR